MGLSPLDAGHGRVLKDTTPNRPPRAFRHASPCPRLDHPVPGRVRSTPRPWRRRPSHPKMLRPCRFPCASPDARVRLAGQTHSLARFSKRTTEHRLPTIPTVPSRVRRSSWDLVCPVAPSPPEFRPFQLPVRGAFQRSLTLLVRYRSRGVFSLGRRCRPRSRGISDPRYSGTDAHRTSPRYGAITLYRAPFQETSRGVSGVASQPEHHIAHSGLRFGLGRVHSPLLTASRLVSLPAGTEMFQFPAFPIATRTRQSQCGFRLGDPEFVAFVRLPRAYRSLARPSSALEPSHPPGGIVATVLGPFPSLTRRVQFASGLHVHTVVIARPRGWRVLDPSHPRSRGVVHRSVSESGERSRPTTGPTRSRTSNGRRRRPRHREPGPGREP